MRLNWRFGSRLERLLAGHYPYGIAQRYASTKKSAVAADSIRVLFIALCADKKKGEEDNRFTGEQGELLGRAITQGLKWPLESVGLVYAFVGESVATKQAHESVREKLAIVIKQAKPDSVVVLGKEIAEVLALSATETIDTDKTSNDRFVRVNGTDYLLSFDLRSVASDVEVKRVFWQDLKFISKKCLLPQ